jgi:hypothetical protein
MLDRRQVTVPSRGSGRADPDYPRLCIVPEDDDVTIVPILQVGGRRRI